MDVTRPSTTFPLNARSTPGVRGRALRGTRAPTPRKGSILVGTLPALPALCCPMHRSARITP
eukprot:3456174-Alexandrium_andersonii.AAC.1